MLELIVWLATIVGMFYLLAYLSSSLAANTRASQGSPDPASREQAPSAPPATPQKVMMLAIDDALRIPSPSLTFVKGFGIRPDRVLDLCFLRENVQMDRLPEKMVSLLNELYARGFAKGFGIMEVIQQRRPLSHGDALYFALVQGPTGPEDLEIHAFVDRDRSVLA